MSSSSFTGNGSDAMTGLCPAAPPPPPPPPLPVSGQVPVMRINTAEVPAIKRPQIVSNDGYEPPAAIQNAMLTKDKKPFTYTPGMGGKLDLSQIRSPRMARRVAKNANDEGIEGPPKSALEPKSTPAQINPNVFVQPQVAVPVFPTNIPPQPSLNRTPVTPPVPQVNRTPITPVTPPTPPTNRFSANGIEKIPEPPRNIAKVETKVTPITVTPVASIAPESPGTPTQVTLAKAPTPWMQNKVKPQEELPEWAKRTSTNKQSPPIDSSTSPPVYPSVAQQNQQPTQQKQPPKQQPQQYQYQPVQQQQQQSQQSQQYQQYQQPTQFNQPAQPKRAFANPSTVQQANSQAQERVIPIRIEDRPSVFDAKAEPGHHQFKQPPSPHHQQRWGQAPVQNQVQAQQAMPVQAQLPSGGAYIIPIMVEGSDKKLVSGPGSNTSYSQPVVRNSTFENQTAKAPQQRGPPVPVQQGEPGPVQSRSFRVLQKITDTDAPNDVDPEQLRKLQLTEDDRVLMNKFKEQVDTDSFLHHEEDPRYRGAAIPSRAFRFLQTMTDGGEVPVASTAPRMQNSAINKKQNRNSKSFEESQANLPPSEQQVQEPKKYMGSAIPSRSFRILQAMTAPENTATQENRQADYTCQTETNVPGNQQGVFYPTCPPPFWTPEMPCWGYYPLPYSGVSNDSKTPYDPYPYQQDGTAYIYYPIYNQNYVSYPIYNPVNGEKNEYPAVYSQYVVPASLNNPNNYDKCSEQASSGCNVLSEQDSTRIVSGDRFQDSGKKISNETNNLNFIPKWDTNDISRTASTNSNKDSDCTTAMNITDEEEIPESVIMERSNDTNQTGENLDTKPSSSGGLNINVPNYTYIDTSDSTDSTDSESHSDNESVVESSKATSSNNLDLDNSSSDSDDSESYLAYSTGLNPHGRTEDNPESTEQCNGNRICENDRDGNSSSDRTNCVNCHSNSEVRVKQEIRKSKTEPTFPHKLGVIHEDIEQAEAENLRAQSKKNTRIWREKSFETTDDPPDDADTTVSVSLPLRIKFSVSENNEDVTTVIVGDSTIKEERPNSKDEARSTKSVENQTEEAANDVSVNYQVSSDTTVDFTVKRAVQTSEVKRKIKNFERVKEEQTENKGEKTEDLTPHVNFTLRKIPTRLNRINCEETIETEYTIKSKKSSMRKEDTKIEQSTGSTSISQVIKNRVEKEATKESGKTSVDSLVNNINSSRSIKTDKRKFELHDYNKNIVKPEVVVSECVWNEDSNKAPTENPTSSHTQVALESNETNSMTNSDLVSDQKVEDDHTLEIDEKGNRESKHLLSVQNSREETDDEDSGVTSDMSRIISEVDTDSECTSSRKMKKYQRTQTHSRLFRLLNDDSIPDEDDQETNQSSKREYLSLPLESNASNYDENYCSNYSSTVTSPEYSPICEQSWRRLHEPESNAMSSQHVGDLARHQDRPFCQEDPYYQAWKISKPTTMEHDVLPSLAYKILENRKPFWPYKVNVLCPRIKSTKSVPQALQAIKATESSVPPVPVSCVNVKNDHC